MKKFQKCVYNHTEQLCRFVRQVLQESWKGKVRPDTILIKRVAKLGMMPRLKILATVMVAIVIMAAQVGTVSAARAWQEPASISGTVQSITLETNSSTGIFTVQVVLVDTNKVTQTVRVSLEAAIEIGLVTLNGDGSPVINEQALGQSIEIEPAAVIPEEEAVQHPVGSALAIFFSDILGIDYETIMTSHEDGFGFGVIAQALWLTEKLDGDSDVFAAILEAKKTGDYSVFILPDGTTPKNWGQLRKAILSSEKDNLGIVMSEKHENNGQGNDNANENGNNNGNGNGNGNEKPKDNKDKQNNGNDKDKKK